MSHRLQIRQVPRASCPTCARSAHHEFEAKAAHENLMRKYTELSDLMLQYVSQAPLERAARNRNAAHMAKVMARIVGGVKVNNEHPDCCLIGEVFANGLSGWFCTGVLIHPRIVLTAGHCHGGNAPLISTVALRADDQNQLGQAEILSVRRAVVHPRYQQTQLHSDMTVLILREDSGVAPVPLATPDEMHAAAETLLVGFGNSDVNASVGFGRKRKVEVDIEHMRRSPGDDLNNAEAVLGFESDLEFVAGGEGFDSCNGDSGGPAYIVVNGVKKLAGLTSRATEGASTPCGEGGIYTRVDKHLEFIAEVAMDAGITLP